MLTPDHNLWHTLISHFFILKGEKIKISFRKEPLGLLSYEKFKNIMHSVI